MFLFDRERTGRSPFALGTRTTPEVEWETMLKQYPPKGPESTAVLDADGNLYFGCHDNCIYSLNARGQVRWQFTTEDKVYSSPILLNNRIYICCNKADVLCLDLNGALQWQFNGFKQLMTLSRPARVMANLRSYLSYDYEFKKYLKINAWNSPNLSGSGSIVVNLYGLGVVSLDSETGKVNWKTDLGQPFNHLAGVAITGNEQEQIIAVSQCGSVVSITRDGRITWKQKLKNGYNAWGNPTIDAAEGAIYCSNSRANAEAFMYRFDLSGKHVWTQKVSAGIRGSMTISNGSYVLVPTMKGELLFVDKLSGKIVQRKGLATHHRGLWTSACIDSAGDILINTKLSQDTGSLIRLSTEGKQKWEVKYGKALAVPVIDREGCVFTATWEGKYLKLRT